MRLNLSTIPSLGGIYCMSGDMGFGVYGVRHKETGKSSLMFQHQPNVLSRDSD